MLSSAAVPTTVTEKRISRARILQQYYNIMYELSTFKYEIGFFFFIRFYSVFFSNRFLPENNTPRALYHIITTLDTILTNDIILS